MQKYGTDTFAAMNAAGGGTNLPKRMNGITYAVGGGPMGSMSDYGYEEKNEEQSSIIQNEMKERKNKRRGKEKENQWWDIWWYKEVLWIWWIRIW